MKLFKTLTIIVGLAISINAHADGREGGGGKGVYCKTDGTGAFPSDGLYALDYVLARQAGFNWTPYSSDTDANLKAIVNVLETKLEPYLHSQPGVLARALPIFEKQWTPLNFPLQSTPDQANGVLSRNCAKQTVQLTTKIEGHYYYNPEVMLKLTAAGSAQLDAHKTHEFLRYIFDDSLEIAMWNRIVHSPEFFTLNETDLVRFVRQINPDLITDVDIARVHVQRKVDVMVAHYRLVTQEMSQTQLKQFSFAEEQRLFDRADELQLRARTLYNEEKAVGDQYLCQLMTSKTAEITELLTEVDQLSIQLRAFSLVCGRSIWGLSHPISQFDPFYTAEDQIPHITTVIKSDDSDCLKRKIPDYKSLFPAE